MKATQAKQLLKEHNLTLKQFHQSKTPCSYSETRNGIRYHEQALQKFIKQHEENFPLIEGEMFEDWG